MDDTAKRIAWISMALHTLDGVSPHDVDFRLTMDGPGNLEAQLIGRPGSRLSTWRGQIVGVAAVGVGWHGALILLHTRVREIVIATRKRLAAIETEASHG